MLKQLELQEACVLKSGAFVLEQTYNDTHFKEALKEEKRGFNASDSTREQYF